MLHSIRKTQHMINRLIPLWRIQSNLRMFSITTCAKSAILCTDDEYGVRKITLNNPKQRNVLSFDVLSQFKDILMDVESPPYPHTPPIGCLIIASIGHVFSAGHDLGEMTLAKGRDKHQQLFDLCAEVMMKICGLSVPVIAQVRGNAAAAGCQLVASCDIVIASENALFSTPGINVGAFCSTPGVAVIRALPPKVASYMLYTGLPIKAKDAAMYGLVSLLVADDVLEDETLRIARVICGKSLAAQKMGKQCLQRQMNMCVEDAYREATKVMVDNIALDDTQTGIEAFLTKKHKQKPENHG